MSSAVLCFLQEVLGSNIAAVPVKRPPKNAPVIAHILARGHIDIKAVKMALYGFFIAAPLGHYLVGALQKAFAGRTGTGARIGQILASNLIIAPIQTAGESEP
jgi:peroxisomal membrane protein 2